MSEIRLENVTKRYESVVALDGVSFSCKDGEFFTLLGPSGAGKTTTLEVIAGLKKPDEGKIYLDNEDAADISVQDRDVAMAFEDYALYSHMKVYDNIAFPLRSPKYPEKLTKAQEKEKVEAIANRLGIGEYLDRMPKQLSGGQKQRVSLARAMVRKPKIFLLDEPIAHLDAKLRALARSDLKRIAGEMGTTIVYVTHNYREALALSDRILIMREGKVEQIGTPDEIYNEPESDFVANLVGDPPINFMDGELKKDSETTVFEFDKFKFALPDDLAKKAWASSWEEDGKNIVRLACRPESLTAAKERTSDIAAQFPVLVSERKDEEILLKFRVKEALIIASMGQADDVPGFEEPAWVQIDLSKVYFFRKTMEVSAESKRG
ncbi:MAG: ABC transporter ATP-binding protein [Lachnospiraceae bacterium]|jgi:ABC-type sugar transport system ATPase subunit|nr:ABC transporter ATP-binding protein [Lachnospiraceae bacterium]